MNNIELPLVSIIMPAYNAESFIEESIQSVIKQSYTNWELIVVDDNSSDSTRNIVEKLSRVHSNIVFSCNSMGVRGAANARNSGLKIAKGKYIAFLDSDDIWLPKKLSSQIELMEKRNYYASHSSYYRIAKSGVIIGTIKCKQKVEYNDQLRSNYIPNLTGIYNREMVGVVYQRNIGHEDYDMWLNVLKKTPSIGIVEPLAKYRVLSGSLSSNKVKAACWHYKIISSQKDLTILNKYYLFLCYLYKAIVKRVQC
ncbi:TPA: glycosyltransferase family 2 protein [Vibrio vulnificus]|nr:glycosyltransferase family 2 protein [Vibrio vulnificus]HDY8136891.1 glycosyltransferase family 2 protein [Vibrio vulnificus]HDY8150414.1 glycosyltransferase family 2 protein [Vibrio vulnificus]HDY8153863.1 glycosyltransferase family 2 protein [Vibrio vulnificus]